MFQLKRSDIRKVVEPDEHGTIDNAYGVYAKIEIWVPLGDGISNMQVLRSAGLWDIDVNGGEMDPYIDGVFEEEKCELEAIITAMGITLID